jgi:hypothetical protein
MMSTADAKTIMNLLAKDILAQLSWHADQPDQLGARLFAVLQDHGMELRMTPEAVRAASDPDRAYGGGW